MLRAVQQLRMLREPDSFRAWLAAIAVRRVSTHLHRVRQVTERLTALDDVTELPDVEADVEGLTLLRLELSAQRRQAVRAGRWLDPADRALLSLWWLEIAGQLNRTELAAALGVSVAHAGVRVQRLRVQLDLSRSIVASLEANPGCAQLGGVTAEWDGRPGPLWRKRIARHTRSCPVCVHAADEMVPAERLLVGVALLPVPLAVTAALLAKTTSTAAAAVATSTVSAVRWGRRGREGGTPRPADPARGRASGRGQRRRRCPGRRGHGHHDDVAGPRAAGPRGDRGADVGSRRGSHDPRRATPVGRGAAGRAADRGR